MTKVDIAIPGHPAKFSPEVLHRLALLVSPNWFVLDPFAGVGGIHDLPCRTVGVELEPEWASAHPDTIRWDASQISFLFLPGTTFDAVVTSPCYGNRMADHHNARERCRECKGTGSVTVTTAEVSFSHGSMSHSISPCPKCEGTGVRKHKRITYRHCLDRPLSANSSAGMQWGKEYRRFHEDVWAQCVDLIKPGGEFLLNISDHVRKSLVVPVSRWHVETLEALGLETRKIFDIPTRRMGYGANRDLRVDCEYVVRLVKR